MSSRKTIKAQTLVVRLDFRDGFVGPYRWRSFGRSFVGSERERARVPCGVVWRQRQNSITHVTRPRSQASHRAYTRTFGASSAGSGVGVCFFFLGFLLPLRRFLVAASTALSSPSEMTLRFFWPDVTADAVAPASAGAGPRGVERVGKASMVSVRRRADVSDQMCCVCSHSSSVN